MVPRWCLRNMDRIFRTIDLIKPINIQLLNVLFSVIRHSPLVTFHSTFVNRSCPTLRTRTVNLCRLTKDAIDRFKCVSHSPNVDTSCGSVETVQTRNVTGHCRVVSVFREEKTRRIRGGRRRRSTTLRASFLFGPRLLSTLWLTSTVRSVEGTHERSQGGCDRTRWSTRTRGATKRSAHWPSSEWLSSNIRSWASRIITRGNEDRRMSSALAPFLPLSGCLYCL